MKLKLLILTIAFPLLSYASQMQNRDMSPKDMKTQNKLIVELAAQEMSKSIPRDIDKYTKLTDIKAQDTTLIYTFEIDTTPKSDDTVRKEDHSRMEKAVTYGTCENSKRFLDADISIRYIYKSASTKAELFKFDINKSSCLKL